MHAKFQRKHTITVVENKKRIGVSVLFEHGVDLRVSIIILSSKELTRDP
jgi:hypothetical protein